MQRNNGRSSLKKSIFTSHSDNGFAFQLFTVKHLLLIRISLRLINSLHFASLITTSNTDKAWDTLIIGVQDAHGATFIVQQRTGVQKIREGKLQPKTFIKNHPTVGYDPSTHHYKI